VHKPIEVTPIQMLRYGYINIKNECFSLIDLRKANASRRVSEIRLQAGIVERRTRCSLNANQVGPEWAASHHHQTRRSPLGMSTTWPEERHPLRCTEGVLFAIGFAAHFEVIITKGPLAVLQRNVSAHCSYISSHMV